MSSTDMDKIKSKIKKALALAVGSTGNESEIALRQAMKMMARHGVSEKDLAEPEIITIDLDSGYKRIPQHARVLSAGVAHAFGVYLISRPQTNATTKLTFVGLKSGVERATYIYTVASRLLEEKCEEYFTDNSWLSRKSRSDYRDGAAIGFTTNLIKIYADEEKLFAEQTGTALVPVDTRVQEAEDFFLDVYSGEIIERKNNIRRNAFTARGFEMGQNVTVSQGINGENNSRPALGVNP